MRKADNWLEKMLLGCAKELLKRHPLRRGPYLISDAELRRAIRALSQKEPRK